MYIHVVQEQDFSDSVCSTCICCRVVSYFTDVGGVRAVLGCVTLSRTGYSGVYKSFPRTPLLTTSQPAIHVQTCRVDLH